jgi:protein transport protein YIF1
MNVLTVCIIIVQVYSRSHQFAFYKRIEWALQLVILKGLLYSMGSAEVPLLNLVAYAGYLFAGLSLAVVARLIWAYSYYAVTPWMNLCMGVFLVRTMKRVLFTEVSSERHSSRQHYFLLFMATALFLFMAIALRCVVK